MKITELRKLLDQAENKGHTEIIMYNDGYYEDFDVVIKNITKCGTLSEPIFGKQIDIDTVKHQYKLYGIQITFDEYLEKAVELRKWQKENWFDSVETAVITPLEF